MTQNQQRIVLSAWDLLRGDLKAEPKEPFMCLALVRVVLEAAFWRGQWRLYDLHKTATVDQVKRESMTPYARDLERSLRDQGMALTLPRLDYIAPDGGRDAGRYVDLHQAQQLGLIQGGDIVFRHDVVADKNGVMIGHIGIVMPAGSGLMVLENAPRRDGALGRLHTYLGRLGLWPVTSVARFVPREPMP